MADETSIDINPAPQANGEDTSPAIGLISQYVKDLSFENPNAPAVFQWQSAPQMDVQFNIAADGVGDNLFEVTLKIDVTAKHDEGTAFVIELSRYDRSVWRHAPFMLLACFVAVGLASIIGGIVLIARARGAGQTDSPEPAPLTTPVA